MKWLAFFMACIILTLCNSPNQPSEVFKTTIVQSETYKFPLMVGNRWVYKHYVTPAPIEGFNDDTMVVTIVDKSSDTFTVKERRIMHSDNSLNKTITYRVYTDETTLHTSDTSGIFSLPLCISMNCVDSSDNPKTTFHQHRTGNGWDADSVFEYNDFGDTPADGCGGLQIDYSPKLGIIYKNEYCGWNVSSQWIVQRN